MDSQLFYLLNFIFALAFVVWFIIGRKSAAPKPTVLSMKSTLSQDKSLGSTQQVQKQGASGGSPSVKTSHHAHSYPVQYAPRERDVTSTRTMAETHLHKTSKPSRAMFVYNGHDWDAYQVMGVTADHSISQITEKYQLLIKTNQDPGRLEFLETAYRTLLKNF